MHFDRVFTVFLTMTVEMTSIMLLNTLYFLRALVFFRGDYNSQAARRAGIYLSENLVNLADPVR